MYGQLTQPEMKKATGSMLIATARAIPKKRTMLQVALKYVVPIHVHLFFIHVDVIALLSLFCFFFEWKHHGGINWQVKPAAM